MLPTTGHHHSTRSILSTRWKVFGMKFYRSTSCCIRTCDENWEISMDQIRLIEMHRCHRTFSATCMVNRGTFLISQFHIREEHISMWRQPCELKLTIHWSCSNSPKTFSPRWTCQLCRQTSGRIRSYTSQPSIRFYVNHRRGTFAMDWISGGIYLFQLNNRFNYTFSIDRVWSSDR